MMPSRSPNDASFGATSSEACYNRGMALDCATPIRYDARAIQGNFSYS